MTPIAPMTALLLALAGLLAGACLIALVSLVVRLWRGR